MSDREEKTIYELFRVSIVLKAIGSVGEMIAGIFIAFISVSYVLRTALFLTQGDIDGDADDFFARGILHLAHSLAISNSWVLGGYIFMRGLIQFLLVVALFKNKIWAYPLLLGVLALIVCIQSYEIYTSHSIFAAAITIIDLITMGLVWHEYQVVRKAARSI